MHFLKTLWQFSRPHTIFGSICSVVTLYLLAAKEYYAQNTYLLFLTLIASLACNVFIVGLNQIVDVELDKINKPDLPLAAGTLSITKAKYIIYISLVVALVTAFMASKVLGFLITIITIIGYLYSAPPVQLKRHHLPAALCITVVRGVLVNLGMFMHFKSVFTKNTHDVSSELPTYLYVLTIFVIAFSIAIAWFKDLPDTEGDAQFKFKTLAVLYKPKLALSLGSILVLAAYVYCIVWSVMDNQIFLTIAHSFLLALFIANLTTIRLNNHLTIKRFYMRFWIFFFMEYIIFAVWALLYLNR